MTPQIFPSKGILASDAELEEAFSTADKDEVCKIILSRGELQISEKERQSHLQRYTFIQILVFKIPFFLKKTNKKQNKYQILQSVS